MTCDECGREYVWDDCDVFLCADCRLLAELNEETNAETTQEEEAA